MEKYRENNKIKVDNITFNKLIMELYYAEKNIRKFIEENGKEVLRNKELFTKESELFKDYLIKKERLNRYEPISENEEIDVDTVKIGDVINCFYKIDDEYEELLRFKLIGPYDSLIDDPHDDDKSIDKYSVETTIGRALYGAKTGEVIEVPAINKTATITINYIVPDRVKRLSRHSGR